MSKISKSLKQPRRANHIAALERQLGPIEYRPVAELTAYERNPRKHLERQLVSLAASIAEFGFSMPVLVDEAGIIIAGEARVAAAKRLGMETVPVLIAHHWSPAQVRAYRLADNRLAELASWDEEMLAIELAAVLEFEDVAIEILGWETAEIDVILDGAAEPEKADPADEQVPEPSNPVARAADLWVLGGHRLYCGSSLDAESWFTLLGGEIAAMAFTDPPYNVPVSGHVSTPGDTASTAARHCMISPACCARSRG